MFWILYSILIFLGTCVVIGAFIFMIRIRLKETKKEKDDLYKDNKVLTTYVDPDHINISFNK